MIYVTIHIRKYCAVSLQKSLLGTNVLIILSNISSLISLKTYQEVFLDLITTVLSVKTTFKINFTSVFHEIVFLTVTALCLEKA